ncbi:MAG: protein TolQ [Alphaproteobacteria bacterium]
MSEISATAVGESLSTHDFSVWGLFLHADFIVQLVMLMLLAASIWCWTIIFAKYTTFKRLSSQASKFESTFWGAKSIEELYDRISGRVNDPFSAVFAAAMREWKGSNKAGARSDVSSQQRIERVMNVAKSRELDHLEKNMGFLATVGSTAPFVGLFGTVWGIMNSFQGIATMQSTNLAVVAPGIAEALFATALGLVAAIPAVIAYNKLSTDLNRYGQRLETFMDEFSTVISRKNSG